jgi:hypothetical protein
LADFSNVHVLLSPIFAWVILLFWFTKRVDERRLWVRRRA